MGFVISIFLIFSFTRKGFTIGWQHRPLGCLLQHFPTSPQQGQKIPSLARGTEHSFRLSHLLELWCWDFLLHWTSEEAVLWKSLADSILHMACPGEFFHQAHPESEGWASYTSGTHCPWIHSAFFQFTLQDKDGGRWNCQRNLMWCLKKQPESQFYQKRKLLAEAFLVHPGPHSLLPSLNSDSICCFSHSHKHLSINGPALLQGGGVVCWRPTLWIQISVPPPTSYKALVLSSVHSGWEQNPPHVPAENERT